MTRKEAVGILKHYDVCLIHCVERVNGVCPQCKKAEIDTAITALRETGGIPNEA